MSDGKNSGANEMEMQVERWLQTVKRLFLDTVPVIYYVEEHPHYVSLVDGIFDSVDQGILEAVVSPITLAECLVAPYRASDSDLQQAFIDTLTTGSHTYFAVIDRQTGEHAAKFRACYNLGLADALQLAVALEAGCDAFLTNDMALKRVMALNVITLNDMLEM